MDMTAKTEAPMKKGRKPFDHSDWRVNSHP